MCRRGGERMNRKTMFLAVAGLLLIVTVVAIIADGRVGGWIRAQLGIKPSIVINFASLDGSLSQKALFSQWSLVKPECRETVPERVQVDCTPVIEKVNGVPVSAVRIQFERDRLTQIEVSLPAPQHKPFMIEMRAAHGMWSQLDRRDPQGAALVAWSMPGGQLVMSEDAIGTAETMVRWTSKAGLFRETVREIGQLIQIESNLAHVTATVQVQPGARSYDTTSPFRRSFRRVRAISNEFNGPLTEWIAANAETVPSPLLLELAQRLMATDPKEGLRWFATFRVLNQYDAARCTDPTAGQGSSAAALLALYPSLERRAQEGGAEWRQAQAAALSWVRVRQVRSSPMWLCSSGMRAVRINRKGEAQPVSVSELMLPESAWPGAWRDVLERASR